MAEWTCPRCGRTFLAKHARHACVSQPPEAFFAPYPHGLPLLDALRRALPHASVEATKTQVAFRARRRFAFLWIPSMALRRGPPDVYLAFDLPRRVASPRIKESIEVRPGLWTHHMLLRKPGDVDAEARAWLREARDAAA